MNERVRPHWLPPEHRLMDLRTAAGIRRAVPILAVCVVHGHCSLPSAMAVLLVNYRAHVWRGSQKSLDTFWDGALDAMNASITHIENTIEDAENAAYNGDPAEEWWQKERWSAEVAA